MRYLFFSIIFLIVLGFLTWYTSFSSKIQTTITENCLDVLNKYISNHPNNLHCDVLENPIGGMSYKYTEQNGDYLLIWPSQDLINLYSKNGSNLSLK